MGDLARLPLLEKAPTTHAGLLAWVEEVAELTQPDRIHWVDGSEAENTRLTDELVAAGTLTRLNEDAFPKSFAAFSDPADVARVEEQTFICSENEHDAGFTNNWMAPAQMKEKLRGLFAGSMRGRTMYVIPFVMGHLDAEDPKFGVEITDSAYVVASMRIMATHRHRGPGQDHRDERVLRPRPALPRRAAGPRPGRRRRGPATRTSGSCTSPRSAPSGPSAPATAATPCWARSATPCASPR